MHPDEVLRRGMRRHGARVLDVHRPVAAPVRRIEVAKRRQVVEQRPDHLVRGWPRDLGDELFHSRRRPQSRRAVGVDAHLRLWLDERGLYDVEEVGRLEHEYVQTGDLLERRVEA